jgi:hypothetical protein
MKIRSDIKAGQGLGDAVAGFTHLTGLDQVAKLYEQATGKDCGCSERQATLNKIFPNLFG